MKNKIEIPTWEQLQVWSGGKTAIQITHEGQEALEYCVYGFSLTKYLPRKKKKKERKDFNILADKVIGTLLGSLDQYHIEMEEMKERVWDSIQEKLADKRSVIKTSQENMTWSDPVENDPLSADLFKQEHSERYPAAHVIDNLS